MNNANPKIIFHLPDGTQIWREETAKDRLENILYGAAHIPVKNLNLPHAEEVKVKINFQDYSESAVKINGVYKCLECERTYKREPRVEAGMRCGRCSYGLTCHNGHRI